MDREMSDLKLMVKLYSISGYISLGLCAYALFKGNLTIAIIFVLLNLLTSVKADITLLEYKGDQFSKVLRILALSGNDDGNEELEEE